MAVANKYWAGLAATGINRVNTTLQPRTLIGRRVYTSMVSNQDEYKKVMYNAMNEPDTGQDTSNPYILAKRVNNESDINLVTLNSILRFNNVFLSAEEFEQLKGITPLSLPYPIPAGNEDVMSILGKTSKSSDKVVGAYVLTHRTTSKQYVGGSLNLAKRVRYYYGSKGLLETRTIAKLMAKEGPSAFDLQVYVLNRSMLESAVTRTSVANIVLALEQYLILTLKPTLNGVLVVGGVSKNMSGSTKLAEVAAKKMKPVYLYNKSMDKLVYESPSLAGFVTDSNLSQPTVSRCLASGKPVFNTYIISYILIETATASVMTPTELSEEMAHLHKNRMKLRNHREKITSNMHPIYLTDLNPTASPDTRVLCVSKWQAQEYTSKTGRPINIKHFSKSLPFTLNGWLVESATNV